MKCPNCGAEVTTRFCEYCGSEQPRQEGPVTIINNYYNDPPAPAPAAPTTPAPRRKRKTFWWVMGWIFVYPIPLTILIIRAKRLKLWLKLLILIAAWALYFVIALTGSSEEAAVATALLPL